MPEKMSPKPLQLFQIIAKAQPETEENEAAPGRSPLWHFPLGCPTFWRLRKNKLKSNSDRIFVADFKNDVIFQL